MGFLRELRERRLVQILLSYGGVGWIMLEATDQIVGQGLLPEWMYRVVLIWFIIGIPATLLIGWHHGEKGKQRAPLSEMVVLGILALAAVGFSGSTVTSHYRDAQIERSRELAEGQLHRIAVTYFEDPTNGEYQHLADALTEVLISELGRVSTLDVVSRNGTLPFRGSAVSADSVGRVLRANTVVEGRVDVRQNKIHVTLALVDPQSGLTIERARLERPADDPLAAMSGVAEETGRLLRRWVGREVRLRATEHATTNARAWLTVQRAEKLRKDAETLLRQQDEGAADEAFEEADRLLAQAQDLDRAWAEPLTQRAVIAYRRARLNAGDRDAALAFARAGLGHANAALQRSRNDARALEMRGSLTYVQWLLRDAPDPAALDVLIANAERDLKQAVAYDPTLATAHATLAHLYGLVRDIPESIIASRRAIEADAYLESADAVFWRLYNAYEGLGNFVEARRRCEEGATRFPDDFRFANCALRVLYHPVSTPDVAEAWRLLARVESLAPSHVREFERTRGEMYVAVVLGRAGMRDSARAVLSRATTRAIRIDPTQELLPVRAYAMLTLGDLDGAVELLAQAAAADPNIFGSPGQVNWLWQDLQSHPRFRRLAGLN